MLCTWHNFTALAISNNSPLTFGLTHDTNGWLQSESTLLVWPDHPSLTSSLYVPFILLNTNKKRSVWGVLSSFPSLVSSPAETLELKNVN